MNKNTKIILTVIVGIISAILLTALGFGASYLISYQNYKNLENEFLSNDKCTQNICPKCENCITTLPTNAPTPTPTPLPVKWVDTQFSAVAYINDTKSQYHFKYSYPSDWSVYEDARVIYETPTVPKIVSNLFMDSTKISASSEDVNVAIFGYQCAGDNCTEQWHQSQKDSKKLNYSLSVNNDFCYSWNDIYMNRGIVQTCVFKFENNPQALIFVAKEKDAEIFQTFIESIKN